ncbi:coil containing protein [Vibrio phage 1.084.O._10N.261.49.F5]|nr:coil containing protein [Vibrio phage 1.084.O._10N.261.49.F5]
MSNKRRDFRKQQEPREGDQILAKYANKEEQKKEEVKKNEKDVVLSGRTYTIKKWKHLDALDRLPQFMNSFFSHLAVTTYEQGYLEELNSQDAAQASTYALMFMNHLQDIHFREYLIDFFDSVYVKGSDKVVDLDEDLDNAGDIFKLFAEVASVNFMMSLASQLFSLPQTMLMKENEK